MTFDLSRRALALLEAGRPISTAYANAVISAQQARAEDFHKIEQIFRQGRIRDRYQWTQKAVEELAAYRQLVKAGLEQKPKEGTCSYCELPWDECECTCSECRLYVDSCTCGTVGADDYDEFAAWEKEHCEPEPETFEEEE